MAPSSLNVLLAVLLPTTQKAEGLPQLVSAPLSIAPLGHQETTQDTSAMRPSIVERLATRVSSRRHRYGTDLAKL